MYQSKIYCKLIMKETSTYLLFKLCRNFLISSSILLIFLSLKYSVYKKYSLIKNI